MDDEERLFYGLGGHDPIPRNQPWWKLLEFSVRGLFGQPGWIGIDFMSVEEVEESWDERSRHESTETPTVRIIHGRNGIGKTTLLSMLSEVGDLLRYSVFNRGVGGRSQSILGVNKDGLRSLLARNFEEIVIRLAHLGNITDYAPADTADTERIEIAFHVTRLSRDDTVIEGNPYDWDEVEGTILSLHANSDDMDTGSGLFFAVDTEGDFLKIPRLYPADVMGVPEGELVALDLSNIGDEWGDIAELEGEWEYLFSSLSELDIILLLVERKSVEVLNTIPSDLSNKTLFGKRAHKTEKWFEVNDPEGRHRGLLQIMLHWWELEAQHTNQLKSNDTYLGIFCNTLEKYPEGGHPLFTQFNSVDLAATEIWTDIEKFVHNLQKIGLSAPNYMNRDRYSVAEGPVFEAHTYACLHNTIILRNFNHKRELLRKSINDRFEAKSLEYEESDTPTPSGAPNLFGPRKIRRFPGTQADIPLWIRTITGEDIPCTSLSSGEANLLQIYFILTMYSDGRIVLIDEPENSLHVTWQQEFINDVKHIASKRHSQVIVATHSPLILGDHIEDTTELELIPEEL